MEEGIYLDGEILRDGATFMFFNPNKNGIIDKIDRRMHKDVARVILKYNLNIEKLKKEIEKLQDERFMQIFIFLTALEIMTLNIGGLVL